MADFTINQAITRARTILQARTTDARLVQAERTQASETVVALDDILNRLNGGNVLPANRRQQAFNTLVERRHVLNTINNAHNDEDDFIPAPELYNAMDLMLACEEPIRLGLDEIITADG